MAILTFSLTKQQFLSGAKTVTRRTWAEKHIEMWQRLWDTERLVHDAWDKIPIAGGEPIGKFRLTVRPYREQLANMPVEDLIEEGGMCATIDEFCYLIGRSPNDVVTVVRFEKL